MLYLLKILYLILISSILVNMESSEVCKESPMGNSGFPSWGSTTPEFGAKPIISQDFCRKLHENERKRRESLNPPMVTDLSKDYVLVSSANSFHRDRVN